MANLALIYDTETTGLPLWGEPSEDPRQPHIVQLAALMVDIDRNTVLQTLDLTVAPDGWTIPDEVVAVHGITTERAAAIGLPERAVVSAFARMWLRVVDAGGVRVAFGESFDARIVRIALKRHVGEAEADAWKAGEAQCAMRMATPIVNLSPTAKMAAARRNTPKSPKLGEAYEFFMGRSLQGAHSALADARGCLEIWNVMRGAAVEQAA